MGLREWLNKSQTPGVTPSPLPLPAGVEPVWLPGGVEVQVAGESFHADAIRAAQRGAPAGGPLVAELVPESGNPHDPNAVAVYVQRKLVGHHVCCMGPADQIPPGTTVLKGLQAEDPNVTFASDQATAVSDAASADAVVVAVGEKAYAEGLGDNPSPQLAPDQEALISALEATGKPVIVVVIAGRPLGLGPAETADGLLMAYQGSTEAGTAVADAIFGKIDPSGKLPVTWPSDAAAPGGDRPGPIPDSAA